MAATSEWTRWWIVVDEVNSVAPIGRLLFNLSPILKSAANQLNLHYQRSSY